MKNRLHFNFNLDDETELSFVISEYGVPDCRGRRLARKLGWKGNGVVRAANGIANYVANKTTAIACRLDGKIETARQYEAICDRIYTQDLQPLVEVW